MSREPGSTTALLPTTSLVRLLSAWLGPANAIFGVHVCGVAMGRTMITSIVTTTVKSSRHGDHRRQSSRFSEDWHTGSEMHVLQCSDHGSCSSLPPATICSSFAPRSTGTYVDRTTALQARSEVSVMRVGGAAWMQSL